MKTKLRVLRLDASVSPGDSASKQLGERLVEKLGQSTEVELKVRDLNSEPSFIDSEWVEANFTAAAKRNPEQVERLRCSDALIEQLQWADHIVITTPMYNFSVPATLKAWIDQVCRAGVTFRYTSDGPVGLLQNKSADIVITTGGVPVGSPVDFLSGYLKQVFGFIGIDDVNLIAADQMNIDADASFARALDQIEHRDARAAA